MNLVDELLERHGDRIADVARSIPSSRRSSTCVCLLDGPPLRCIPMASDAVARILMKLDSGREPAFMMALLEHFDRPVPEGHVRVLVAKGETFGAGSIEVGEDAPRAAVK